MYYTDIHILSQILNDWARPKTQSHHQDQYFQTGLGWHLPTAMPIHTPGKNWTETLNDHIISTWNSECFVVHQTTESRCVKSLHSLHYLHHWPKGFICSHGLIHQKLWWWKEKIEVSNTILWCQHVNNISKSSNQKHLNIEHQNIIKPTCRNNQKPGLTRAIAEVTKWQALQKEEVCYPPVYGNWQWSGAGKADHT